MSSSTSYAKQWWDWYNFDGIYHTDLIFPRSVDYSVYYTVDPEWINSSYWTSYSVCLEYTRSDTGSTTTKVATASQSALSSSPTRTYTGVLPAETTRLYAYSSIAKGALGTGTVRFCFYLTLS